MDTAHIAYEGIYRIHPALEECALEGPDSLVGILSVMDEHEERRRLEFVRFEDVINDYLFSQHDFYDVLTHKPIAKKPREKTVTEKANPYAFLMPSEKVEGPRYATPLIVDTTLARTLYVDMLFDLVRHQLKPSAFAFWGDALPYDYKQYGLQASRHILEQARSKQDIRLTRLNAQYLVHRYGLTRKMIKACAKQVCYGRKEEGWGTRLSRWLSFQQAISGVRFSKEPRRSQADLPFRLPDSFVEHITKAAAWKPWHVAPIYSAEYMGLRPPIWSPAPQAQLAPCQEASAEKAPSIECVPDRPTTPTAATPRQEVLWNPLMTGLRKAAAVFL